MITQSMLEGMVRERGGIVRARFLDRNYDYAKRDESVHRVLVYFEDATSIELTSHEYASLSPDWQTTLKNA